MGKVDNCNRFLLVCFPLCSLPEVPYMHAHTHAHGHARMHTCTHARSQLGAAHFQKPPILMILLFVWNVATCWSVAAFRLSTACVLSQRTEALCVLQVSVSTQRMVMLSYRTVWLHSNKLIRLSPHPPTLLPPHSPFYQPTSSVLVQITLVEKNEALKTWKNENLSFRGKIEMTFETVTASWKKRAPNFSVLRRPYFALYWPWQREVVERLHLWL